MSMEAEQATVNGLQTEHSRWTFERAVHIQTARADLRSDTADAVFASGRIAEATVKGTPASFEQRNADSRQERAVAAPKSSNMTSSKAR